MNSQKTAESRYTVRVYDEPDAIGVLRFVFQSKGFQKVRTPGEPPKLVPEYVVTVQGNGEKTTFTWIKPPRKESTRIELQEIARERAVERTDWIERVADLVKTIEAWAKGFGWSTKRIAKKIEDTRLGHHKAAGLVMQEDTVRVLLEPISASAPGSDGLVDLYLMPGYDDVASLYHEVNGWFVHYVFPTKEKNTVAGLKEGETRPLSKKAFGALLDEMKKHAE